jgi:hypothetical protein
LSNGASAATVGSIRSCRVKTDSSSSDTGGANQLAQPPPPGYAGLVRPTPVPEGTFTQSLYSNGEFVRRLDIARAKWALHQSP